MHIFVLRTRSGEEYDKSTPANVLEDIDKEEYELLSGNTSTARARFTAAKVPRVSCPNAGQRLNAGCAWVYGRPWGSWAAAEFGWDWVESLDVKKATLAACRAGVGLGVRGQLLFPQCGDTGRGTRDGREC